MCFIIHFSSLVITAPHTLYEGHFGELPPILAEGRRHALVFFRGHRNALASKMLHMEKSFGFRSGEYGGHSDVERVLEDEKPVFRGHLFFGGHSLFQIIVVLALQPNTVMLILKIVLSEKTMLGKSAMQRPSSY